MTTFLLTTKKKLKNKANLFVCVFRNLRWDVHDRLLMQAPQWGEAPKGCRKDDLPQLDPCSITFVILVIKICNPETFKGKSH